MEVRRLVEQASDAAFAIDGHLRVVAWNGQAAALLGYAGEEALGQRCGDVLQAVLPSGEPLCTHACEAGQCLVAGRPFAAGACHARHRDGARVALSLGTVVLTRRRQPARANAPTAVMLLRPLDEASSATTRAPEPRIFTLGRFGLMVGERALAVETWHRKQALTVLKYLVAHAGRAVHRERLLEALWPEVDEKRGRDRLKVAVCFLRRKLRAAGATAEVIETTESAYALGRERVWIDVETFEQRVASGCAYRRQRRLDEAIACFEEARRLYRGDYLEEDLYAEWAAEERERLRELYLEMLLQLAECRAGRSDYASAAQACRTALAREPCRETFHRALMEYLVRLGRADWAVAQFEHCRRVLAQELDVEPMPSTQRLYHQIVQGRRPRRDAGALSARGGETFAARKPEGGRSWTTSP